MLLKLDYLCTFLTHFHFHNAPFPSNFSNPIKSPIYSPIYHQSSPIPRRFIFTRLSAKLDHKFRVSFDIGCGGGRTTNGVVQCSFQFPFLKPWKKTRKIIPRNELWSNGVFCALVVARECVNLQQSLVPLQRRPSVLFISKYLPNSRESVFRLFRSKKKVTIEVVPTRLRHSACDC